MTQKQTSFLIATIVALGIISIVLFGFYMQRTPDVVPEDAPAQVFSAQRAARHYPHIASVPNPIGSQANVKVRQYIIEQIEALGLTPELHMVEQSFADRAVRVGNILLRIPGKGSGRAILFMGHYDTVISAPGASDNGAAVVSLLEVIRMLQHHPQLENDLIFLFPDGEEYGLLGALAFMNTHPWVKDIDLVINLEAMGTTGQSIMFETGTNNLRVVREFARAVPYPVGNSLSVEIYNRMPNYTDFEVFHSKGYQGLNFAYLGDSFNYHTPGDNIENTDLGSVQHHGSYAAALALYMGNRSLDLKADQNAVYFNTLGYGFVVYPYSWVSVITILVILFALGMIFLGIFRKRIRPLRMLAALLSTAIMLLILYVAFDSLYKIIAAQYPGLDIRLLQYNQQGIILGFALLAGAFAATWFLWIMRGVRLWHAGLLFILAIILLWYAAELSLLKAGIALAVSAWLFLAHRKPTHLWDLTWAAMLLWTVLMGVAGFMVPGASYLFTWPLVFTLIPLALVVTRRRDEEPGWFMGVVFLVFAIPVLVWFPVVMSLFVLAMGLSMSGVAMIFAGLMMALLIPHVYLMTREKQWLMPGMAFVAGLATLLIYTVGLDYDEHHRKSNVIIHATAGDTGQSYWFTMDEEVDSWTAQFLTDQPDSIPLNQFFPYHQGKALGKKMNTGMTQQPSLQVLSDGINDGQRVLTLNVQVNSDPAELTFFIQAGAGGVGIQVNEMEKMELQPFGTSNWYRFFYLAPPQEGFVISLFASPGEVITLHLNQTSYGNIPGINDFNPRPSHMMQRGDRAIISHTFQF